MRKTLLSLLVLAGLAGGTAATPADAAPLTHGLLTSVEALLPALNTAPDAVPNEGRAYYDHHSRYGRHAYYGRRSYGRY